MNEIKTDKKEASKFTNIQVSREVRSILSKMGKKGESFNDILVKILKKIGKE